MGTSPSSSTTAGQLWPFQIVLKNGDIFEFFAELPEDQKQWIKRLQLLLMFPYSPIPEEPLHNPIKEGYRAKLKPIDYKAGEFTTHTMFSISAVLVLPIATTFSYSYSYSYSMPCFSNFWFSYST